MAELFDRTQRLAPDQLSEVATSTSLRIDVLSGGRDISMSRRLGIPNQWGVDVTELNSHVRAHGALDPEVIAILAVERESDSTICATPMRNSTILFIPGGAEISASIRPGLRYSAVVVPFAQWRGIETALAGGESALSGASPTSLRLDEQTAQRIAASLSHLPDHLAAGPIGEDELPASLVDYLSLIAIARSDHQADLALRNRSFEHRLDLAGKAQDYICSHLNEDLSLLRLCKELKASPRQLEYAFKTIFGVGPHRFIQVTRLNEARRQLKRARDDGRSITQIAMDLSLFHLSRFAASYHELFGELPSQTYQRGGKSDP